jgi:hypothetical protein
MAKKKSRIALTFGKRIFIVILIMGALMVGVLELAESSKEPVRLGLQDYISRVSGGHPAEITLMEKSEIFPNMEFILKGIVVRDKDDATKALITADNVHVETSFIKATLGLADYKVFQINNAVFATGHLLPKKLALAFAGITDTSPENAPPYFIIEGNYNERDLLITAEMQRGGNKKRHYDFASEFPVTFKLGSTEASARFMRGFTSVDFAQMVIASGGRRAVLRTEGMAFSPLKIRFIGDMGGYPLAGEIKQEGEDYHLYIQPGADDPEYLSNLKALMASIQADLGLLPKDNAHIRIEIRAPDVAKQGIEASKEESPE